VERAIAGASRVYYATPDLERYVRSQRREAAFLPNPVDAAEFAPAAPAGASNSVLIGCGLTQIKGANRILAACRELAISRPDIRFTVIGGGPYTRDFAALPTVTVVRHRPRAEFPALINEHGLVIGQALLGALGMAELEALACARPLIGWFRYDRAYAEPIPMVRALDPRDIADAVVRLVDNPAERTRLGEAARAWVIRHHSLATAATEVERAAIEILGGEPMPKDIPA
jgi:glycosyltransferase involved in cell wall biosynthesis